METYPEMNETIKDLLKMNTESNVHQYAYQRIIELEKSVEDLEEQANDMAEKHAEKDIYINNLKHELNYLKEDNDKNLDTLADVREALLEYVDTDNPCGDMLACTVSQPSCMSCLAKNIKSVIEKLKKDLEKG